MVKTISLLAFRIILITYLIYVGLLLSTPIIEAGTGDAPPEFKVTSLVVSPLNVSIGEKVTVRVTVFNMGGETGSYQLTLKINDMVEETKVISVKVGESEDATFIISKDIPGTYKVNVGGTSSSFTVHESYSRPLSLQVIVVISVSILLFVTLIFWLIRRKLRKTL